MDIVRVGTVGKDFLVHTSYDLTGWLTLKLKFVKPDGITVIEVEDGVNPEDVAPVGALTVGDLGFTDVVGIFPDEPASIGIWRVIPVVTKTGLSLPGAPAMQFRVIGLLDAA